jgi:hypothetical protein
MMKFEEKYAQHPMHDRIGNADVLNDAFVLFEIIRFPHVCRLHV